MTPQEFGEVFHRVIHGKDDHYPGCADTFIRTAEAVLDKMERENAERLAAIAANGFVRCPLCGDVERVEDIVGGVCLTCADGIAFAQNNRRGSIEVPEL